MKSFLMLVFRLLSSCSCVMLVHEQLVKRVESPDGKYVAEYFVRNAGATVGYIYHINMTDAGATLWSGASGRIDDGLVFSENKSSNIDMVWTSNNLLEVRCLDCFTADIQKRETRWKDVNIKYILAGGLVTIENK